MRGGSAGAATRDTSVVQIEKNYITQHSDDVSRAALLN
jgi:hypothetical protein